ncbi:general odorant-binding protein 56a-like [Chelonus insularis]|uniref:general odorant-binding protein 56a-like n=1 Tax=Chelonus insularis TaxID=460826 RepID=UPI00158A3941|nr:general odorant-binding protein 56a-like [Chelonus insularis]
MKVLALIFALCFVGVFSELTEKKLAQLRGYRQECIEQTKVDETMIDKAKEGEWMEDDSNLQCYFSCMMKKIKVLNADGTLNEEKARKRMLNDLPEDKIEGVMMKCKDMKGDTDCTTAMKLMKCYATEKAFIRLMTEKNQ